MRIYIHIHLHVYIYTQLYTYMHVQLCVHVRACTQTHRHEQRVQTDMHTFYIRTRHGNTNNNSYVTLPVRSLALTPNKSLAGEFPGRALTVMVPSVVAFGWTRQVKSA